MRTIEGSARFAISAGVSFTGAAGTTTTGLTGFAPPQATVVPRTTKKARNFEDAMVGSLGVDGLVAAKLIYVRAYLFSPDAWSFSQLHVKPALQPRRRYSTPWATFGATPWPST